MAKTKRMTIMSRPRSYINFLYEECTKAEIIQSLLEAEDTIDELREELKKIYEIAPTEENN